MKPNGNPGSVLRPLKRISCLAAFAAMLLARQGVPPEELQLRTKVYWPPLRPTLTVETRLVEVGVVVRDALGHSVGGLTRDSFGIEDAGEHRDITAFSAENRTVPAAPAEPKPASASSATQPPAPLAMQRPPRYLGLVFDDLHMPVADLSSVQAAARRFLKQGLQADDRVGIFFISRGLVLPFTTDVAKLSDAIDQLSFRNRRPVLPVCPSITPYEAFIITDHQDPTLLQIKVEEAQSCGFCYLRDPNCPTAVAMLARNLWEEVRADSLFSLSALSTIVDFMAKMPGRRALIYASSGFLTRTLEQELDALIPRALHADVVLNALDTKGLYTEDSSGPPLPSVVTTVRSLQYRQMLGTFPEWSSNDTMAVLSTATGGLFFHNNNDIDLGFRELGLVPEFSYILGFSPAEDLNNKYHALKVRLKTPGHYQVQARPGYFAASSRSQPPAPERRIDKEILSETALDDLPVQAAGASAVTPADKSGMRVVLHLDVPHLRFTYAAGVRNLQLVFVAALFDENNAFVVGAETDASFALKEETFNRLANGLNANLTLPALPGRYRLRTVVEEPLTGKLTASSQPVEVQP